MNPLQQCCWKMHNVRFSTRPGNSNRRSLQLPRQVSWSYRRCLHVSHSCLVHCTPWWRTSMLTMWYKRWSIWPSQASARYSCTKSALTSPTYGSTLTGSTSSPNWRNAAPRVPLTDDALKSCCFEFVPPGFSGISVYIHV